MKIALEISSTNLSNLNLGLTYEQRKAKILSENREITEDQLESFKYIFKAPEIEVDTFRETVKRLIEIYPTTSPGGRVLSPSKINTIKGKLILKQCKRIFSGKDGLDELKMAIESVKNEKAYRARSGNAEYMNAIEAWLRQGKFEDSYENTGQSFQTAFGHGKSV
jgi:hypothetical protein